MITVPILMFLVLIFALAKVNPTRWQRFIGRLKCFFGEHDWVSTERNEDHIAGTGWWNECTRCRKWMRLR